MWLNLSVLVSQSHKKLEDLKSILHFPNYLMDIARALTTMTVRYLTIGIHLLPSCFKLGVESRDGVCARSWERWYMWVSFSCRNWSLRSFQIIATLSVYMICDAMSWEIELHIHYLMTQWQVKHASCSSNLTEGSFKVPKTNPNFLGLLIFSYSRDNSFECRS